MEAKKDRMKKVALVGVGLIGKERLKAIKILQGLGRDIELTGIYDPYSSETDKIANDYKTNSCNSLDELFLTKPEWIFIATPHDVAVDLTSQILKRGFKVLVEKPLGRSSTEAKELINSVSFSKQLWVGFNYRFYTGVASVIKDIKQNLFGELISINFILGHGGNPEMGKSWKLDPVRAGGGCLIDPGIHLLDLCLLISDYNLKIKGGLLWKGFWNKGIEEECHLLFEAQKFVINCQISIVRWRSTFYMEVNGTDGYGIVSGRNRSYGKQTYVRGKRWGWLNKEDQKSSEQLVVETNGEDVFALEIDALLFDKGQACVKPCTAEEALTNMEFLEECLKSIKFLEAKL